MTPILPKCSFNLTISPFLFRYFDIFYYICACVLYSPFIELAYAPWQAPA